MSPAELGTRNDCTGEDQQQFTRHVRTNINLAPTLIEEAQFLNTYVHVWKRIKVFVVHLDET
jgi:hypothetical protein